MQTQAAAPTAAKAPRTTLPALTGVRIFAAAAVFMSHLMPPKDLNPTVATFMASGYNGVTFFFILSGFVLGLNYFDRLTTPNRKTTWNYAIARVARIYPLYLAVLLFLVVQQLVVEGGGLEGLGSHVLGGQAWAVKTADAFKYNPVAWSVSVELFLYACFPLLVLAIAPIRRPRTQILVLTAIVGAVFGLTAWFVHNGLESVQIDDPASPHRWLYRMPITRLGDFAAGLLLSRLFSYTRTTRRLRARTRATGGWIAAAGAVALVLLMSWESLYRTAWSWDAAYLIPALAIIWGLATLGSRSFLSSKAMVAAGEASFAFYLIHKRMMEGLGSRSWRFKQTDLWEVSKLVGMFALILMAAFALHYVIERPARNWINRLGSGRGRPASTPLAPEAVRQ